VVGREIRGLDKLAADTLVFHGGTRADGVRLVTSGGRVLNVVARGPQLDVASAKASAEAQKVSFEGMQWRSDIGRRPWHTRRPG
jgi:phosphoribosylamine---glycine ligase